MHWPNVNSAPRSSPERETWILGNKESKPDLDWRAMPGGSTPASIDVLGTAERYQARGGRSASAVGHHGDGKMERSKLLIKDSIADVTCNSR